MGIVALLEGFLKTPLNLSFGMGVLVYLFHCIADASEYIGSRRVISISELVITVEDIVPSCKSSPVTIKFIAGVKVG